MERFTLETGKQGMQDITREVRGAVERSGAIEGLCLVYCPHTTAGLTVNENADPDVVRDLLLAYNMAYPDRRDFRHFEGNSAAHAMASAVGSSVLLPVAEGTPVLGRWQGVYFCEFDGPRTRQFYVQVVPSG